MGVIGAGIGGLTAARELYRYGFNNVHIFEATPCWREVVAGASNSVHSIRAWRHADAILPRSYQGTPFREGAFGKNSELAFYADQFDVDCAPFPNPGTCKSGVYFADSKHGHRLHKYLRVLLP